MEIMQLTRKLIKHTALFNHLNMELSQEQQSALDAFNRRENVFLTGPGGTGKSALIRMMVEHANDSGRVVQVCALTGCAAVLLGCPGTKTVHSWAGVGLANGPSGTVVDRVVKSKYKRANWNKVDVLIIDEVSMMSRKLFDILDMIGKKARKCLFLPFGGIQVVFSGDFYQLPPVGSVDEPNTSAFCFESPLWDQTFHTVVQLTKVFRQTDADYVKALNQIRVGKLYKSSFQKLQSRVGVVCDESLRPTVLLPRRRDAEAINSRELKALDGEEYAFETQPVFDLPVSEKVKENIMGRIPDSQRETEVAFLTNNVMADKKLVLKVGAQVMCVANIDMEGPHPIVNGSQGRVVEMFNGLPMVQFRDGQKRVIGQHVWPSEVVPGLGVKQIPLIHAWAITIHKAQGVTLELAEIDAGSSIFECGQTYVALSRVKELSGLYLTALSPQKIKVNRKVQAFYEALNHTASQTPK